MGISVWLNLGGSVYLGFRLTRSSWVSYCEVMAHVVWCPYNLICSFAQGKIGEIPALTRNRKAVNYC